MATISASGAGNWSATGTWTGGVVPNGGDDVQLGQYIVTLDVASIPATGTLNSITANDYRGNIAIPIDSATFHGGCTINCTTVGPPVTYSQGVIRVSGVGPSDHLLTIVGNLTGCVHVGSVDGSSAVYLAAVTYLRVTGNVSGGTGICSYGINTNANGYITVDGDLSGGSGQGAAGIYCSYYPNVTITLAATTKITNGGSGGGMAISGARAPSWSPTNAGTYIKHGSLYFSAGLASDSSGTAISATDTAENVKAGSYFVKKDTGVLTIGTATGGGGVIVVHGGMNGGLS
jgi:hypothetical protein